MKPRHIDLDVANFNIRATPKMFPLWVKKDVRTAKETDAAAFTWQELGKWFFYRRQLKRTFPSDAGWRHFFEKNRNIITIHSDTIGVIDQRSYKLSKSVPWLPQPARYLNVLHCVDYKSGLEFDLGDIHMANGGYNGRKRSKRQEAARRKLWDQQWENARPIVKATLDAGRPFFLNGDLNRVRIPKLHRSQKIVVSHGIMKMMVFLPDGWVLNNFDTEVIPEKKLKTDHAGLRHRSKVKAPKS